MPEIYVVHSRVLALCERPFCYGSPLRPVWKNFFETPDCLAQVKNKENIGEGSSASRPFIAGVGALRFAPERLQVVTGACTEGNLPVQSTEGSNSDERMLLFPLECAGRIPLRSSAVEDVRVWGHFYTHIYPSGYVVIHLALSLNWQRERSLKEVGELIDETRPWRTDGSWHWNSRIGSGRIHNLYLRLRSYLYGGFFQKHRTQLREGNWVVTIRHESGMDSALLARSLWPEEPCGRIETSDSRLQTLLASSQGCILHFAAPQPATGRRLTCFWQVMQILEFVLLQKQIHADYYGALLLALKRLQPRLSGGVDQVEDEDGLRSLVLDELTPRFLTCLDDNHARLEALNRRIYDGFAHHLGLIEQQRLAQSDLQTWQGEMGDWEQEFVSAWQRVHPHSGIQ